jgi:hypothetical protein
MSSLDYFRIASTLYGLDLSNCTLGVQLLTYYGAIRQVSAVEPTRYLFRILQEHLSVNSTEQPQPDPSEVENWMNERDVQGYLMNHIVINCKREVCRSSSWEGNPDVAGVGVSSSALRTLHGLIISADAYSICVASVAYHILPRCASRNPLRQAPEMA